DKPITGPLEVAVTLYDAASNGTPIWTETLAVTFDDGYFSVTLGSMTPFTASTFDGSPRWIGITINNTAELTPRAPVLSVPYALLANDAVGDIHPTSVSVGGKTVIAANGDWLGNAIPGVTGPVGPTGPQGN